MDFIVAVFLVKITVKVSKNFRGLYLVHTQLNKHLVDNS